MLMIRKSMVITKGDEHEHNEAVTLTLQGRVSHGT